MGLLILLNDVCLLTRLVPLAFNGLDFFCYYSELHKFDPVTFFDDNFLCTEFS